MPLATLIITLVVVGLIMWAINTYIPMQPGIKNLLNIAVLVILVLWVLQGFGVIGSLNAVNAPRVR